MKFKFPGALGKHRASRRIGLLMCEEDRDALTLKWAKEDLANMDLLCDHFGIPRGPYQFQHLATKLAELIVPVFQEKRQEGRTKKWGDYELAILAVELERLTESGQTIDSACKTLSTRQPWASFVEAWDLSKSLGPEPAEALKTAYKSSRVGLAAKWALVARKAFLLHKETGRTAEWERDVLELSRK